MADAEPSPFRRTADGVTVSLRVTPNAGRDVIEGIERLADGQAVLRLRVSAVPDKGKANAAVSVLLGKALGVPKSAITLISGETARLKLIAIAGDPETLLQRLGALG